MREMKLALIGVIVLALSGTQAQTVSPQSAGASERADEIEVSFEVVTVDPAGEIVERITATAPMRTEQVADGVTLELVKIPGGTFMMGAPEAEEGPQHEVSVPSFWMGRFEVTQAQWRAVASLPSVERRLVADPFRFKGPKRPVETVDWLEAIEFCARLSRLTGRMYRLPSEAEWEYATRAGTTTAFHFGPTITPDLVNYRGDHRGHAAKGEYRRQTTDVGSFGVANAFGVYDMHGNVWEWVQDLWHKKFAGAPTDGSALEIGGNAVVRVLRGGSWGLSANFCRSAGRLAFESDSRDDDIGFRVVSSVARTP